MILTDLEKKLLEQGFNQFSTLEKNRLVTSIANKEVKPFFEITETYILEYHRRLKIDILSEISEGKIVEGFIHSNGHTYRLNRDDQLNFLGKMVQLMGNETIDTVQWKTEDVGYISHTREEWMGVFEQGLNHKEQILFLYNTLKNNVLDANTHEEIVAVVWENQGVEGA